MIYVPTENSPNKVLITLLVIAPIRKTFLPAFSTNFLVPTPIAYFNTSSTAPLVTPK